MNRISSCWPIIYTVCFIGALDGVSTASTESPKKIQVHTGTNATTVSAVKPLSKATVKTVMKSVVGSPSDYKCQCTLSDQCTPQHTLNVANGAICPPDYVCCSNNRLLRNPNPVGNSNKSNTYNLGLRNGISDNGENSNSSNDAVVFPTEIPENCTCVDPVECDERAPRVQQKSIYCNLKQMCCPAKYIIKRTSIAFPTEPSCTCVAFDQCHSLITPRGVTSCDTNEICCQNENIKAVAIEQMINKTQVSWTTELPCICVLPDQCYLTVHPRISQCDVQQYICCSQQDLINASLAQTISRPTPQSTPGLSVSDEPICGRINVAITNKIISTETTAFGEFPWMVVILKTVVSVDGSQILKEFVCGGSLLSAKIVLTSAHCTNKLNISSLTVRAGEFNLQGKTMDEVKPHQDRTAVKLVQHDEFNSRTLYYDFALILVNKPFEYDFHIAPICIPTLNVSDLPENAEWDPNTCVATGWGKPILNSNSSYSHTLKKVELAIVDRDQCQKELSSKTYLGQKFTLHSSFICAGGKLGMDTCKGDGGGPLICPLKTDPNRYIQVGITSWGVNCGTELPAVYASLTDTATTNWLFFEFFKLSIGIV